MSASVTRYKHIPQAPNVSAGNEEIEITRHAKPRYSYAFSRDWNLNEYLSVGFASSECSQVPEGNRRDGDKR